MAYNINELRTKVQRNEQASTFLKGCNLDEAKLITAQTMHDVFYIPAIEGSSSGAYIKLAKSGRDEPDRKEMEIEASWYNIFKNNFHLPEAPRAITFKLGDGNFALAVEEVIGKTYDTIFRRLGAEKRLEESTELKEVMDLSARIAVLGAEYHQENPTSSQAYFGEFNEGEHTFLNGKTVKILRANAFTQGDALEKLLASTKENLTNPKTWLFYRDATPLNWIEYNNNPVAIDLGSTSYRPPQFEAIALFETPNTGFETLTEEQRVKLLLKYKARLEEHGANVGSDEYFLMQYGLASIVKNSSGIASRTDHINKNRADIDSDDTEKASLATSRLFGNIEGRNFHRKRALRGLELSEKYFSSMKSEYNLVKEALETF